jgi:hypothetical protein
LAASQRVHPAKARRALRSHVDREYERQERLTVPDDG